MSVYDVVVSFSSPHVYHCCSFLYLDKKDFKQCQFSLSNSFAEPLSMPELLDKVKASGDTELIDMYNNHDLVYVPNGGSLDLRKDIARVIYDDNLSPMDNILVFPGGQIAIQTAVMAFAPYCHSIVFTPGYQSTVQCGMYGNMGITEIPRRPENNWQVEPQKLRDAIQYNTKLVVLNEPHNPSGILMSATLQKEIIDICREHNIIILSDEIYRLLEHEDGIRLPTIANAYEKGISMVAMSKPWGGCGITIGWLACQDKEIVERLVDVQYFGCVACSRASEIQARMVLKVSDRILKERMEIILNNKAKLIDFIENKYSEWFEWKRPNAGAIAFVKCKLPGITSEELGNQLAATGISIKPAYVFATSPSNDGVECYFRIGFGERKMLLALEALEEFVKANEDGWRLLQSASSDITTIQ